MGYWLYFTGISLVLASNYDTFDKDVLNIIENYVMLIY